MTHEQAGVSDTVESRPRRRRALLVVVAALSLLVVGAAAVVRGQPANNDLRVAATQQEFVDALDATKTEWYCTVDQAAYEGDAAYSWADCSLGSPGTELAVEYWDDLDGTLATLAELAARAPEVFASRCTYLGDHVMVTWTREDAADAESKVAAALDGWEQPDGQRDCP